MCLPNFLWDFVRYQLFRLYFRTWMIPSRYGGLLSGFKSYSKVHIVDLFSFSISFHFQFRNRIFSSPHQEKYVAEVSWCEPYVNYINPTYSEYKLKSSDWFSEKSEYDVRKNFVTIFPPFDHNDFHFNQKKKISIDGPYLYLARIQEWKGIDVFMVLAKKFPAKTFWIAGQTELRGNFMRIQHCTGYHVYYDLDEYPNVKYWGFANTELRKKLLFESSCLIQPTCYVEPFGLNVVEAMFSGTPVIAPDRGGFQSTVTTDNGFLYEYNDYKDNTIEKISSLIDRITEINPKKTRKNAIKRFSKETILPQIEEYISSFEGKEIDNFL